MDKGVYNDVDGKESSKRKNGAKLLTVGIAMAIIYFMVGIVMALVQREFNYQFPLEIWWTFMASGSGLLGITLVERFGRKS